LQTSDQKEKQIEKRKQVFPYHCRDRCSGVYLDWSSRRNRQSKADLKPSSEVPPQDTAGAGTLTGTLDTDTNAFKYHLEFRGLTGPVVAALFAITRKSAE
jgi:hypothetical protein